MTQRKWKRNNLLAILLILVSLLAIAPSLTNALQQNGTISINASGQANPIPKKGTGGPASLSLSGNVQSQGNDPMKFNGLFGTLTIIGTNYPVTGGSGEMNNKGKFEIQAKAAGNELVLHGTMQGGSVVVECPQSKLASQYFLCLTGQVSITTSSSSSPSSASTSSSSSSSSSSETESEGTVTQTVTLTETTSLTSLQNSTFTQNVTQTVTNNQTATTTVFGNQTVTETLNGTTTTVFGNQTVTETITVPQNFTTTTTEFNQTITTTITEPINQTITATVTTTVANSTITQTTTTTVANVTITETTTTTVANTTITFTNTTAPIIP